jgi:serine/threonine-protein kinase
MTPTRLGPYEIVEELASGGMATVFVARHARLGQFVAVKVLHPQFQKDQRFRARFLDEARIQANLRHPHILAVQDILELPEATGMVMELLEGDSLAAWLRALEQPPAIPVVLGIFLPLLEALAHAHSLGIVHRDLKPSNVFLHCPGGEAVVPKLMDFGIAKLAAQTAAGGVTAAGTVLGTPQYMAPEQFEDSSQVDARADIWAIGIMLYEATLGTPPFQGDTMPEIMRAVLSKKPKSPSLACPGFPAHLEHIILTCLAKDREERYAEVSLLKEELARLGHEIGVEPIPRAAVPRPDMDKTGPFRTSRLTASRPERKADSTSPYIRGEQPLPSAEAITAREKPAGPAGNAPPVGASTGACPSPSEGTGESRWREAGTRPGGPGTDSWGEAKWPPSRLVAPGRTSAAPAALALLLVVLAGAGIAAWLAWPYVAGLIAGAPEAASGVEEGPPAAGPPARPEGTAAGPQPGGAPERTTSDPEPSAGGPAGAAGLLPEPTAPPLYWPDLPRAEGLQSGRWCEDAQSSLTAEVLNARLQAGWRGKRLSQLGQRELELLGIGVKKRDDFTQVRKEDDLAKATDLVAMRGCVKPFGTSPLSGGDLQSLTRRLTESRDLANYVDAQARFLCRSLPLTAIGKPEEAGKILYLVLAELGMDMALFLRLDEGNRDDRMIRSEYSSRAVCCLVNARQ